MNAKMLELLLEYIDITSKFYYTWNKGMSHNNVDEMKSYWEQKITLKRKILELAN